MLAVKQWWAYNCPKGASCLRVYVTAQYENTFKDTFEHLVQAKGL